MANSTSSSPGQFSSIMRLIAFLITVCAVAVTVTVWAANRFEDTKDWAGEQDFKQEMKITQATEKGYVSKQDFVRLEECLNNQKETMKDIKAAVSEIRDIIYSTNFYKRQQRSSYEDTAIGSGGGFFSDKGTARSMSNAAKNLDRAMGSQ
jgi:hypothetical protein